MFEPLADDALLLRFGEVVDTTHNARALEAAGLLREQNPSWLRDIVPACARLAPCSSIPAGSTPHNRFRLAMPTRSRCIREAFAERRYEADATLTPRSHADASLDDPTDAAAQAVPLLPVAEALRVHLRVAVTTTDNQRMAAGAEHRETL